MHRRHPIDRLRAYLHDKQLDGFVLPRADEFQGEYVPAAHERLLWLTGFSGSAGFVIVMHDAAALFVDGRYILQAPQEVDTDIIEIIPIEHSSPIKWLGAQCKKGQKIGIDPRLHSLDHFRQFMAVTEKAQAQLITLTQNPIDILWHNRPPLPASSVDIHDIKYAGKTSAEKRSDIARKLRASGQDKMLITQPENIAWLLNIRGQDVPHTPFILCFGILHNDARFDLYIEEDRIDAVVRAHLGNDICIYPPTQLAQNLQTITGKIRVDGAHTPAWFHENLAAADICEAPDLCIHAKACKNSTEIKGAIRAHKWDGAALCNFLCWLHQTAPLGKISELNAIEKLYAFRKATEKLRDISFDTIAGSGPNGAIVHYRANEISNRTLTAGDIFLCDSGGQYNEGTTDVTRTILIPGATPPDDAMYMFTRVLQAHIALACARFPTGTNGMQLDAITRVPLWQAGVDFSHGTGHGVGSYLSVHEGPQRISKGGMVSLEPGMIISNEPGYYRTDHFGIRIENLYYVTTAASIEGGEIDMLGLAPLTLAPLDKQLIDKTMLTRAEIDWLNGYHALVYDMLGALVEPETRLWLREQCTPL